MQLLQTHSITHDHKLIVKHNIRIQLFFNFPHITDNKVPSLYTNVV